MTETVTELLLQFKKAERDCNPVFFCLCFHCFSLETRHPNCHSATDLEGLDVVLALAGQMFPVLDGDFSYATRWLKCLCFVCFGAFRAQNLAE